MISKTSKYLPLAICLAAAPLFSIECIQYPEAYNAPAAISFCQSASYYFDASFIYWYAREEGLYLAESALLLQGNVVMAQKSISLGQSFEFKPGFKIGMGVIYDQEWALCSEYTWLRSHTTVNKEAPENTSSLQGLGIWNVDDWFQQTIVFQEVNSLQGQSLSGTSIASSWRLGIDIADLDLSRPYYEGSSLTIFPFAGLRAAWIRQAMKVALTQAAASEGGAINLLPQPIFSHNHSHCWGLGPRMGFKAKCLLPMGCRLEGSGAASLLATSFTTLSHGEDAQSVAVSPGPYLEVQSNHKSLLPNAEMGLGIGWEGYGFCDAYHFDFSASYDFTIFWGQNRMREMLDNFWSGTDGGAGDLFFHGLTLSGRFDF